MNETSIDELWQQQTTTTTTEDNKNNNIINNDIQDITDNLQSFLKDNDNDAQDNSDSEEGETHDMVFPEAIHRSIDELISDATAQTVNEDLNIHLTVHFEDDQTRALYASAEQEAATTDVVGADADVGWDVRFASDETVQPNTTHTFDFKVSVRCVADGVAPIALLMMPRSSIVRTPLRLANSVGLIDPGYRGTLKAVVDHRGTEPFSVRKGERLFQLVAMPTRAMSWNVSDSPLPPSARGKGGFGSTGR